MGLALSQGRTHLDSAASAPECRRFKRQNALEGPPPQDSHAAVDFGWDARPWGVDFRWVWPSRVA
jgi:hypothetical protein